MGVLLLWKFMYYKIVLSVSDLDIGNYFVYSEMFQAGIKSSYDSIKSVFMNFMLILWQLWQICRNKLRKIASILAWIYYIF